MDNLIEDFTELIRQLNNSQRLVAFEHRILKRVLDELKLLVNDKNDGRLTLKHTNWFSCRNNIDHTQCMVWIDTEDEPEEEINWKTALEDFNNYH